MEPALTALFLEAGTAGAAAAGVFARVGAMAFLLPGIGERGVPARLRLAFAFLVSLMLFPMVAAPDTGGTDTPAGLGLLLVAETVTGLVIGFAFRLLVFALQIAGTMAAQSVGISHMFGNGVAQGSEPTLASLLAMGGIVIALSSGLHVHLLAAMAGLYRLIPMGTLLAGADLAAWSTARVAATFGLALSLALPFVAVGFTYNLMLGALSRAMPQLLVALIGVPLLVGLGFGVLILTLPDLFDRWSDALQSVLYDPLGGVE